MKSKMLLATVSLLSKYDIHALVGMMVHFAKHNFDSPFASTEWRTFVLHAQVLD